ncbi:MAG: hypothetical protein V1735_06950 [Nanoarchaeota archaeon]
MVDDEMSGLALFSELGGPRVAHEMPVAREPVAARDWYASLFNGQHAFPIPDEEGEIERMANEDITLVKYLIEDPGIFAGLASEDGKDIDPKSLLRAIVREVVKRQTGDVFSAGLDLGDMVFAYGRSIQDDNEALFKDLYLGRSGVEEIADRIAYTGPKTPKVSARAHAGPKEYIAAEALLRHFPQLDVENPAVGSIQDLKHLLTAHVIYDLTKDEGLRQRMAQQFVRPDIDAKTKLIYNGLLFYQGFLQHCSDYIGRSRIATAAQGPEGT